MKPFQLVFHYSRKYTVVLTVTTLSMLLLMGAQLLIPWIIRTLIAAISSQPPAPDTLELITKLAVLVLAIYVVRAGLQFLRSYLAHLAGWGVVADCASIFTSICSAFHYVFMKISRPGSSCRV